MSLAYRQVLLPQAETVTRCDITFLARLGSCSGGEGYLAVMTPIQQLQCFIDESTDETRKDVFGVGAFLASERYWRELQEAWTKRLDADGIAYFRSTSCKSVTGPFHKLRKEYGSLAKAKQVAEKIRADLEEILLASHWIGFGIGIVIPDYKRVLKEVPEARVFYSPDPTVTAYSAAMFEVVRAVRRNAENHRVAYIIDGSSYSEKIKKAFDAIKVNHPILGKQMITFASADDKITPPLQMADLIAHVTKDLFLEWSTIGNFRHAPLANKWEDHFELVGKWDEPHMLRSLIRNLKSPRLAKGLLPVVAKKFSKKELKAKRKALVKAMAARVDSK